MKSIALILVLSFIFQCVVLYVMCMNFDSKWFNLEFNSFQGFLFVYSNYTLTALLFYVPFRAILKKVSLSEYEKLFTFHPYKRLSFRFLTFAFANNHEDTYCVKKMRFYVKVEYLVLLFTLFHSIFLVFRQY